MTNDDLDAKNSRGAVPHHVTLTVKALIRAIFPRGTKFIIKPADRPGSKVPGFSIEPKETFAAATWDKVPPMPPDVFAVCGLLLDLSGACHHIIEHAPSPDWVRQLTIDSTTQELLKSVAQKWRDSPKDGKFVRIEELQAWWSELLEAGNEPVFILSKKTTVPQWWRAALCLFIAADTACEGVGFPARGNGDPSNGDVSKSKPAETVPPDTEARDKSILEFILDEYLFPELPKHRTDEADPVPFRLEEEGRMYTISSAPPDLVCVLPKSRTSQIGCTLRSLSHHLALLPARGTARAHWHGIPVGKVQEDTKPLNLLLIPYPYDLPPSCLRPVGHVHEYKDRPEMRWGWFELKPDWAPKSEHLIVPLVENLAQQAKDAANPVNGIVFPESSLSYDTFNKLLDRIGRASEPDDPLHEVEFVVAGLRSNDKGEQANFAATCVVTRSEGRAPLLLVGLQHKHHRWRLDQRQINDYGLGSSLAAGVTWWEMTPLLSRSLEVFVFRSGSTLAPLICEDLARLEPVHSLVRSIGPSLVIALLLDGPQVSARWPGRYAMGLADDPGSSILTLSSLGPVARSINRSKGRPCVYSVALWRDEKGDTKEICLEPGDSAILLSLAGQKVAEHTVDGRGDGALARRWVYSTHCGISLPAPNDSFEWARAKPPA